MAGWGGGGDVKLMGAVGTWLGPIPTLIVIILSALVAGMIVICQMLYRATFRGMRGALSDVRLERKSNANAQEAAREEKKKKRLIPYAVSAAVATWAVVGLWSLVPNHSKYWRSGSFADPPEKTTGATE
jgi:prepilin peptidase CpaA